MERKKKVKSTIKRENRVGSWWKNYCKRHNLDKKDAKYCFIIFLILMGFLFSIVNNLVAQMQIICLREGVSVSLCDCVGKKFKRKPYYFFSNKGIKDIISNCSLNENDKNFPKLKN